MTPTEYLETEFRRYYPDATEIDVDFHDDETITVDVLFVHPTMMSFSMEIGSDDDYFIFTSTNGSIITVPLFPESEA